MKKIWETGVILFAAMGFWGMIYPDLCFTQDVCRVVYVDTYGNMQDIGKLEDAESAEGIGNAQSTGDAQSTENVESIEDLSGQDMYTQLSNAKPGQIRVKSAFFDYVFGSSKEASKDASGQSTDTPKHLKETASITESKGNSNGSNKGNKGSQ
ncbi:hypothetical protein EDD76_101216 [Kineothrix alysoides]|uniref:Uncharacterized protein n=1 Tax=Kineothrix alysoides TaxID=1469948 RepID=A0A4R1R6M9_9FIRM|nr:hypothetical protein [Kineothrix alysoides]TCL61119.1 hypothetical protein EDD76_101216 [Kineothrix alysoides]